MILQDSSGIPEKDAAVGGAPAAGRSRCVSTRAMIWPRLRGVVQACLGMVIRGLLATSRFAETRMDDLLTVHS
jgi:hypothetical protein